jgi:ketosteroid isomerase-like protein
MVLAATAAAVAQAPRVSSQPQAPEELAAIRIAAEHFLRTLDNLEWEPFRTSWASDPSVFFPFADTPDRVDGAAAVEARWQRFFEQARTRRAGPPYLQIRPRDVRVDRYGDVGLVTFTFDGLPELQGQVARRTLVLVQERGAWKVVHLHASASGQR